MSHEIKPRVETPTPTETHDIIDPYRKKSVFEKINTRAKKVGVAVIGLATLITGGLITANVLSQNEESTPEPSPTPTAEAPAVTGETTAPATEVPTSEASPSDLPSADPNEVEVISSKENVSSQDLVALYYSDPEAFTRFFTITLDDIGMTKEEAYADPQAFGEKFAEVFAILRTQLLSLPNALDEETVSLSEDDFLSRATDIYNHATASHDQGEEESLHALFDDILNAQLGAWAESDATWSVEVDPSQPLDVSVDGESRIRIVMPLKYEGTPPPTFDPETREFDSLVTTHVLSFNDDGTLTIGSVNS